jgi:hypothetical protein
VVPLHHQQGAAHALTLHGGDAASHHHPGGYHHHPSYQHPHHAMARVPSRVGFGVAGGGLPGLAAGGGGAVVQRAVSLHDDVASQPILIERVPAAEPKVAQPFPHDACRAVAVVDNTAELAAEAARQEAADTHAHSLARELKKQADGSEQELKLIRASVASQVLQARVSKLGGMRHYMMISMMRALSKWALLLELDDSYNAALTQAAAIIEHKAHGLSVELDQAQQRTVKALLVQPQMLGELGEMRRKLQAAASTTESLRGGLQQLVKVHEDKELAKEAANSLSSRQWLPLESGALALRQRFAPELVPPAPPAPAPTEEEVAARKAAEIHRLQQQRTIDALRLKLRLTLHHWRMGRIRLENNGMLLRQLSMQRNEEVEAKARAHEALRRLELEKHELLVEQETWRQQSAEQAEVIAQAVAQAANGTIEHEDEVLVLSEKLRQVLDEKSGLEALVESQAMDLQIMSAEMIRMSASAKSRPVDL